MTEFVRVLHENGIASTMPKGHAEANGLNVIDEPAVDGRGRPLPAATPTDSGADEAPGIEAPTGDVSNEAPDWGVSPPSSSDTAASTQEEK